MSLLTLTLLPTTTKAERIEVGHGYAKTWGGTGNDLANSVAIDQAGNFYVGGRFSNTVDFDPGAGVDNRTSNGAIDAFVSKLDSAGNYLYTRTWGGTGSDEIYSVAVDQSNNVYVGGRFQATVDFDPGAGVDNRTSNGSFDAFVSKLDSAGNNLYAKIWGGTGSDLVRAVSVDQGNDVYIAGGYAATIDFDLGAGTDNRTSNGGGDAFVTKLDSAGDYIYAKTWGGTGAETGFSVALDQADDIYIAGEFAATVDFDPSAGVDNRTSGGAGDAFITKLDSAGNYLYAKTWGGTGEEEARAIIADQADNIYIAGEFSTTVDFDPGAGTDNRISNGSTDAFVTKLDSTGNYLYAKTWGGTSTEQALSVLLDPVGNVYIGGIFQSTVDFDPSANVDNRTSGGTSDAYITKLGSSGAYLYAQTWGGGTGGDAVRGTAIDQTDSIYNVGNFTDTVDFDPGAGMDSRTSNGDSDVFVSQLTQTYFQHITGLDSDLEVIDKASGVSVTDTDEGVERTASANLQLQLAGGTPLADLTANMTQDRDWSGVDGDSDLAAGKAFIDGVASAEGASGSHSLYVPKLDGHNAVGYCPTATSLAAANKDCANLEYLTVEDSNVSVANIEGQDYWVITGLTASAGFSTALINPGALADTGDNLYFVLWLSALTIASGSFGLYRLKQHSIS